MGKVEFTPDSWTPQEKAYVSIISVLISATFIELLLWLMVFAWAFYHSFRKSSRIGTKILSVVMTVYFWGSRALFFPIAASTLPLPESFLSYIPSELTYFSSWIPFWCYCVLFIFTSVLCSYRVLTERISRKARIKEVLNEETAPTVIIVMPVYNEVPSVLMTAIESAVDSEYPKSRLHIFVSFDNLDESELYHKTVESLGGPPPSSAYRTSFDLTYKGCRFTVSRFLHGGKRSVQKKSFEIINNIYGEKLKRRDDIFLLFIDSDIVLDKFAVQNFMYDMELKAGSTRDVIAMTGVITCTTEKLSLITIFQDLEYVSGLLFDRCNESACGAVTCLPGALTMLRLSAFRRLAKHYFSDKSDQYDDLFDYGKCHLGEDRWLTHLIMLGAKEPHKIKMCTTAFCKTQAVTSFSSLLKQRRRWLLGFVTNEVCILTDARLWRKYPLVLILRLLQDTMGANLFLMVVFAALAFQYNTWNNAAIIMIFVVLATNWLLMTYFAMRMNRFKVFLYPLVYFCAPLFNWIIVVYGVFTSRERTWGGPRVESGKTDDLEANSKKPTLYSGDSLEQSRTSLQPPSPTQSSFRFYSGDSQSRSSLQPPSPSLAPSRFYSGDSHDHSRSSSFPSLVSLPYEPLFLQNSPRNSVTVVHRGLNCETPSPRTSAVSPLANRSTVLTSDTETETSGTETSGNNRSSTN